MLGYLALPEPNPGSRQRGHSGVLPVPSTRRHRQTANKAVGPRVVPFTFRCPREKIGQGGLEEDQVGHSHFHKQDWGPAGSLGHMWRQQADG